MLSLPSTSIPGEVDRPDAVSPTCAGMPLELFYDSSPKVQQKALQTCGACPLQMACLREELQRPITHQHGVRGGLTASRRKQIIREWRAAERDTESTPASTATVIDLVLHAAVVSAGAPASAGVAA